MPYHVDSFYVRLKSDAEVLKKMISEQLGYFQKKESIDSVEQAEYALETHGHHVIETTQLKDTRLKEIKNVSGELHKEKFEGCSEIDSIEKGLENDFSSAHSAAESKKKVLTDELANQKAINERLCTEFANLVKAFGDWLQKKKYLLSAQKDTELEAQLQEVNNSTKDHSEANTKLQAIQAADEKVKARQITNNPHTNLTYGNCSCGNSPWINL